MVTNMKLKDSIVGFAIGTINSLLGSGGGLLTVPYLNKQGLSQQKSQATSTAVILPLSIISTILYLQKGLFNLNDALIFLPAGIAGAVLGGVFLKKIPSKILKVIFSAFMFYAGIRMIIK